MTIGKPRRRTSVSMAKNLMRRAMNEIVDPSPNDVGPVWQAFGNRCAYCDVSLDPDGRVGHIDHAVSGGGNHLGNLVLSCARCNGDAKREESWQEFLRRTVTDADAARERAERISAWIEEHPAPLTSRSPDVERVLTELDGLVDEFGRKCDELRHAAAAGRAPAAPST